MQTKYQRPSLRVIDLESQSLMNTSAGSTGYPSQPGQSGVVFESRPQNWSAEDWSADED